MRCWAGWVTIWTSPPRPGRTTSRRCCGVLPAVWTIGKEYGTVGCQVKDAGGTWVIEVTTFRSDAYADSSRKPEVLFGDSVDGDLSRRDFTVNAMAVSLPDKQFVGPVRRLADLASGCCGRPRVRRSRSATTRCG